MNAPQPEGFDYTTLLKPADKVEFRRAGEIIFEMGQPGSVMYVIKSGRASIRVGDRIFDTVEKGATIGEMAILDGSPRSATALAVTDCEIVAIDKARLLDMVQHEPSVAIEMTKSMVRRLRSMNYQAQYDLLTQLPNRTLFREHCINALRRARREEQLVGVLYLDLDHFENINDSLGYAAADTLLGQVASRLRSVLRDADTLARLGADEFAVLVEAVGDETELALTAQRMQEALAEPFEVDGKTLYLTASIGISCHPGEGSEVEILMKNADTAMHAAKDAGRNQYSFFSAALNARALEFLNLKTALREALGRSELLLYYQPRVALDTGAIHGVEALLRWQHPEMGMVSPARFIPIAEQAGYIESIGDWVLQEGCRQQKAWLDAGLPALRMAINLSALQMRQADLVDRVRHILAETGLPAEYLELEITESALVEDQDAVADKLRAFREMGIAIALDDFGTGYSAMSYLKKFPLDYMKIDQSFVRGIPKDRNDVAITRTIVALASNLDLKVVVEGVETEEQLVFARNEGCDEFQGFFFSRPVPPAAIEELLRKAK
ncbi:MAG: EAL domain-containing protein [Sterolibacteriaceae bacterium MAG5]|nr:EAL domain-containing protein [Candidatus Nitricoxidireducens bremensis]